MATFQHTCERCKRFIVWQNEGEWFCWYCDPTNSTTWRAKPNPIAFEIEDDFVFVESGDKKSESKISNTQNDNSELRNRVLGCLIGFAIGEAVGASAKDGPTAIQTEGVEPQHGVGQLIMGLNCLIDTAEDSSMAQDDFAKRLLSVLAPPCVLTRRAIEHPQFLETPEKVAREIWESETKTATQSMFLNTALARAIAAGVVFQGDHETASAAAKALTTVTHNDTQSRYCGAATALSAIVAMLLARPSADVYGLANEAFEFAAADLHAEEQEDEIYELHRHLFPADLEDLELKTVGEAQSVLKALGAAFYCLTSNRIHNSLSKAEAEHAGNLSEAENKRWSSLDDEQILNPVVFDAAASSFADALAAQMKKMEERLLALAGEAPGAKTMSAGSPTLPLPKSRPSADLRQAVFQEQLTTLALEGGSAEVNCAIAGALLGAEFGLDGLPPAWLEGFESRIPAFSALWDSLQPLLLS